MQGLDVLVAAYAARGDEVELRIGCHYLFIQVDGRTLQGAVFAYFRAEHVAHTLVDVFLEEREEVF